MADEIKTLLSYLADLKTIYINAVCSFHVYESLRENSADNIVGKEQAEKNVKAMNAYAGFFSVTTQALRVHCLIELAKLFDGATQSLHLNKIVNYAESNIKGLSKEHFLKFHEGRKFLDELFQQYVAMKPEDIQKIRTDLEKYGAIIAKLNAYRDQHLAHNDKHKQPVNITVDEIKELFKLIEEILNLFNLRLDFSTTVYGPIKRDCKAETTALIETLQNDDLGF